MFFLLLQGCPSPCVGVGCGEDFSSALVGVLTELGDTEATPSDPQDAAFTISGTREQGPRWSLAIGSDVLLTGSSGDGTVYSFPGRLSGGSTTESAEGRLVGESMDHFGASLAILASRNGDDLLVGAAHRAQTATSRQDGAVMRFAGLGEGFRGTRSARDFDLIVFGEEPAGRFGEVVVPCGDMDQDGLADWAASGTWDSSNLPLSGITVLAMSSQGPESGYVSARDVGSFWVGTTIGARSGAALHCLDDMTGDGIPDLLIGAPFADQDDLEANGAVYLIAGPSPQGGPLLSSEYPTLRGLTNESWLGWALDVGDLNADGVPDLAIGAPGAADSAGEVIIWDGAMLRSGDDSPFIRVRGTNPGDKLGQALKMVDLDGDGADDLLVGAPHHNPLDDQPDAFLSGALYIFMGAPGFRGWTPLRDAENADAVLTVAQQYLQTGQSIVVGDFSGDGMPDVGLLQSTEPE